MKERLKRQFATLRNGAPDPIVFIEKLPASPAQLQRDHLVLYASFYSMDSTPMPAAIDLVDLETLDESYTCRNGSCRLLLFLLLMFAMRVLLPCCSFVGCAWRCCDLAGAIPHRCRAQATTLPFLRLR